MHLYASNDKAGLAPALSLLFVLGEMMTKPKVKPTASLDVLRNTIHDELVAAGTRSLSTREQKKNYAEVLSRKLAQRFANALRSNFDGILPDASGKGQESKARSSKGFKKLDVNYSTLELGLGLGVSIKTINFPDGKTNRYTKNYTRVDAELRAEATDYHDRQPYAVLIAVIFLPLDACEVGSNARTPSSFGSAAQFFRFRGGRQIAGDSSMLFEEVLIGLYDTSDEHFGDVQFFDVKVAPPKHGRPLESLSFKQAVELITQAYDARNNPTFVWADTGPETIVQPPLEFDEPDDEIDL